MLDFHHYLDIWHNYDGIVTSTHWLHFTHKEIPCYLFLLAGEWTPGLLNSDRTDGSYQELNPELPMLWHCASTNYYIRNSFVIYKAKKNTVLTIHLHRFVKPNNLI
jgi:hypothetical protein